MSDFVSDQHIYRIFEPKPVPPARRARDAWRQRVSETKECLRVKSLVPIVRWFPEFLRGSPGPSLLRDIRVGVTGVTTQVPQGLAYGLLARVPAEYGLYTCLLPPIVYCVFGTSRHLSVGVFAMVAMLAGEGVVAVVPIPEDDPIAAVAAASTLALLTGLMLIAFGMLRLGFLATFLSDPVLNGCTMAMGIIIPTSQMKYAFEVDVPSEGGWLQTVMGLYQAVTGGQTNFVALSIFMSSLVLILLLQYLNTHVSFLHHYQFPPELVVVIASTVAVKVVGLHLPSSPHTVSVLGVIPVGLPGLVVPDWSGFEMGKLVVPALLLAIMTFVTSISAAKTFARKFAYEVDNNQELIALGMANIGSGFMSGFPAGGSLSRTAMVAQGNPATALHNIFTTLILILCLTSFGPLLETLPKAALAASITLSFRNVLVNGLRDMVDSLRVSCSDFVVGQIAFWSTLLLGISGGIAVSVAANVLYLNFRASMPSHAVLGLLDGTTRHYRNRRVFEQARSIPGVLIVRFDAPLHFANREVLVAALWRELAFAEDEVSSECCDDDLEEADEVTRLKSPNAIKSVVLDFSAVGQVDVTAARALEKLRSDLASRGIRLVIASCRYIVFERMSRMGLVRTIEKDDDSDSDAEVSFKVEFFQELENAVQFCLGHLPRRGHTGNDGPLPPEYQPSPIRAHRRGLDVESDSED